jgi:hypothetical protein
MDLRDAANGYLGDTPELWHGLTARIAISVAVDVTRRICALDKRLDGEWLRLSLTDEFRGLLLSPANVVLIANARSEGHARGEVARCLRSWVVEADIPQTEEWAVAWREYVTDLLGDAGARGVLIDRLGVVEAGVGPMRLPVLTAVQAHLDPRRVSRIIGNACASIKPQEEQGAEESDDEDDQYEARVENPIRLGIVDLALYQALCAHPELLRTLEWRAFEKLLADALETFGYAVELQRGTKDGGVDIFAVRNDHFGAAKYILQAKRWSNRVSVEPVRELLFLQAHHRATKCCLATTSSFTKGALELGNQYRWQLDLRDWEGLQAWVREAARLKSGR